MGCSMLGFPVHHQFLELAQTHVHRDGTSRSDQISRSVVSDSLRLHESQHARPPCPSPTPRVHSDSHPSSQWCHPAISSSIIPFFSCLWSFAASVSFLISRLFASSGQSIGTSASATVLPMTIQNWFPLEIIGADFKSSTNLRNCATKISRLPS